MLVVCTFSPYRVTKSLLEDVVAPACKTHTPRGAQIEQPTYCFVVDSLAPHMGKKGGQSSGASRVSAIFLGGLKRPQRCMHIVGAQMLLTPPMSTSLVFAGARNVVIVLALASNVLLSGSPVTSESGRTSFVQSKHLGKVSSEVQNMRSCLTDSQVHDWR